MGELDTSFSAAAESTACSVHNEEHAFEDAFAAFREALWFSCRIAVVRIISVKLAACHSHLLSRGWRGREWPTGTRREENVPLETHALIG